MSYFPCVEFTAIAFSTKLTLAFLVMKTRPGIGSQEFVAPGTAANLTYLFELPLNYLPLESLLSYHVLS